METHTGIHRHAHTHTQPRILRTRVFTIDQQSMDIKINVKMGKNKQLGNEWEKEK